MIILVTVAACLFCGMVGCFVGYMIGVDRQPSPPPAPEPLTIVTARESYDFWEEIRPGSHARSSPRVTAGGGFPALPAAPIREGWQAGDRIPSWGDRPLNATEAAALNRRAVEQPPLGELVHAGRTTDVIEKMRADTDRWLAARGLEA